MYKNITKTKTKIQRIIFKNIRYYRDSLTFDKNNLFFVDFFNIVVTDKYKQIEKHIRRTIKK